MKNFDFLKALVDFKSLINKILLVFLLISLIAVFFTVWAWAGVVLSLGILIAVNSLCIVMPGYSGYLIILGRLWDSPIKSGLRFVVPFISSVTPVDVRLQKHEDEQSMKTANLRDITLKYVLTYKVNPDYVHLLHSAIGEEAYLETGLCPWLDAVITQVIASKTYEDINGQLAALSREVEDLYLDRLRDQCRALAGVNLFSNISVAVVDVKFDEEYTRAVSELAKVQKEKEVVEAKAEQLKISKAAQAEARAIEAAGEAKAILETAQAEAEAFKLKGDSENEIKEKLGIILREHPELLKEVLARNFPKVYGSTVSPMVSLEEMLK